MSSEIVLRTSLAISASTDAGLVLTETQKAKVEELIDQLQSGSLEAIHSFGREVGASTREFADTLLEQVRPKDLDVIGSRLSEIVVAAKTLNLGALSENRSRIPLIGGLIDKVKLKTDAIVVKFQGVRTQVDSLLGEVQSMQNDLAQRVDMLEQAFESVREEHGMLGAHVEAGDRAMAVLAQKLAHLSALAQSDPMKAQTVQDLKAALTALEKRVADMRMLQHAALQQLPMIRMVQANNSTLSD